MKDLLLRHKLRAFLLVVITIEAIVGISLTSLHTASRIDDQVSTTSLEKSLRRELNIRAYAQAPLASTTSEALGNIHNMGLGASDAKRVEDYVRKLAPSSPIIGRGAEIINLAREFNIDPLMIFIFQNESQFCSDNGVVSPGGSDPDNYNCGGIIWEAAQGANTARWNATPGPVANGHTFTFVPTISDGLGLYFDYIAGRYKGMDLVEFYNTYNPCNDPGNGGRFECGEASVRKMYEALKANAGAASTGDGAFIGRDDGSTNPGVGGGSFVLSLVLQPKDEDSYVMNTATAQAIGGGGSTNPGGSTDPVNPDATCPGVGPTTCGTLAQGCHCSAEYNTSVCGAGNTCSWCIAGQDSSKYAIDISNPLDGPVYIPKISAGGQAHTVTCKGYADISGSTEPNQSIKVLSCVDDSTQEAVWMQFHHSKLSDPTVAGKSFKTGDVTGHSAAFEVLNSGPHVHFQIGIGGPCGSDMAGCRNANEFVQCN